MILNMHYCFGMEPGYLCTTGLWLVAEEMIQVKLWMTGGALQFHDT